MNENLTLRSVDIESDAEALARMWNESDSQWPGTWTGGVPFTAQRVREWYKEEDALDVMIWATPDGRIVGYCSLQKGDEPATGYVHVLNVHPDYQKQSLGRKFLTTAVERCVKLGFKRLDLGTWPGNLKAVPLYKKTGFFWMPDTQVDMYNYVPAALQSPIAQPYFSTHDWYGTYRRRLEQKEDDERWRGMKVFTYHWEEGGNALTMWADREGRSITAMETDELFAAAIAERVTPAKGMPVVMRWEITNKSDKPLPVSLIARGTDHLKLDYRDVLQVPPGKTLSRDAEVEVAADAPTTSPDKPAPKIETLMLLGGELLELGTGLRAEDALKVETMPRRFVLTPGVPRQVNLQLHNGLEDPIKARVSLATGDGLAADPAGADIELAPHGRTGLPITLQADEPGALPLHALVDFELAGKRGRSSAQDLAITAGYPGQALVYELNDKIIVDGDGVSCTITRDGGRADFRKMDDDTYLCGLAGEYGPPYDPSEFALEQALLSYRVEGGQVIVTTEMTSKRFAGLKMVREMAFNGGPLVRVVYKTLNQGDEAFRPEFMPSLRRSTTQDQHIVLPLRSGLIRTPLRSYPVGDEDVPRQTSAYAESWIALEGRSGALGIIWNRDWSEFRLRWRLQMIRPRFECPAHAWAEPFEFWIYAGAGGWQDVQRAYARLAGQPAEVLLSDAGPVVRIGADPATPIVQGGDLASTFRLENRRERELVGRVDLVAPEGWSVEPNIVEYTNIERDHPLAQPIALHALGGQPASGVYELEARLSTRLSDTMHRLPFVVLGDGSDVAVSEEEREGQHVWAMENGVARFTVAPGHAGSLISWETPNGGQLVNHLNSSFPKPGAYGWMAPWYGGLYPTLRADGEGYPGKLYEERLQAQSAEMRDGQGLTWRGITVAADLQREAVRGLRVEVSYLTLGKSPLIKTVFRVINLTKAARKVWGGIVSFWALDGESNNAVLRAEDWESKRSNLMDDWIEVGFWGSVTNPNTGRTALVTSPSRMVVLLDEGFSSHSLNWGQNLLVPPAGAVERVAYLVMCDSFEDARRYVCLKERLA